MRVLAQPPHLASCDDTSMDLHVFGTWSAK